MPVAAVSAADLAYIQAHPSAVVTAQKPLLKVAKQNHKNGAPVCTIAPAVTGDGDGRPGANLQHGNLAQFADLRLPMAA